MNREEKIAALKKLLDGVPVEQAFPVVDVTVIHMGDTEGPFTMVEPRDTPIKKGIPWHDTDAILASIRELNPFKRIVVTWISNEEYEKYSAWFEENF